MFLKSIKLENFRCFSNHELSFVDDDLGNSIRKTTILLGDNGTGKSNLLKAIGLVTAGRDALAELLDEPESWIQVGKEFCQLDAVLRTAEGKEQHVFLRIEKKDTVTKVLDRARESLAKLDDVLEHGNNYFVLAYGASRRLNVYRGRRTQLSYYRHVRARNVSTLFNPDEVLIPIELWAMDLDYRENRDVMDVISKVMSDFLKGMKFSGINKRKGQLIFETPLGTVPMSQLSDGFQNMAAWAGDLLYQITEVFNDYKTPLKTRGLLLIDEVDLHLHPRWQREMLTFLRQKLPNFQVIATTHSPITAQQANENELYYIERRGKSLKLHQFTGVPMAMLLHQLVMSDIFGLASDESVVLEKKKARYKKLCKAKQLTDTEKKEMEKLEKELRDMPVLQRGNLTVQEEHLKLMEQIQKDLSEHRE